MTLEGVGRAVTTTAPTSTTAQDLLGVLRRHYLPPGRPAAGIFAPEIPAPGGHRRADLIFQGCTAATEYELVGHEIKVSRADLAAELADLTKSDPWQRLCDRWWLVVPSPALVDGVDLPATWGVLAPPSGRRTRRMTVVRPAPRLAPDEQGPGLRALATWLHWRHEEQARARTQAQQAHERAEAHAQDLQARVTPAHGHASKLHEVVEEIVTRLGGPTRYRGGHVGDVRSEVPIDDVVAVLQDAAEFRNRLRRDRGALRRAAEQVGEVLASVDRGQIARLAAPDDANTP